MKIAAAEAIAKLAREEVPDSVLKIYNKKNLEFGKDYIIPTPFDPRLITVVSNAVAKAAMESGVAKISISNLTEYQEKLRKYGD
jgi:malate dehydrogenase (oxaloacetate-decarboxylating)(NADP+)